MDIEVKPGMQFTNEHKTRCEVVSVVSGVQGKTYVTHRIALPGKPVNPLHLWDYERTSMTYTLEEVIRFMKHGAQLKLSL